MSNIDSFNNFKKRLSKSSKLDRMKTDMLNQLEECDWTSNLDKQIVKTLSSIPEVQYKHLILSMCKQDDQHHTSSLQEMNWEEITKQLVNTMEVPDGVKEKLFAKWGRRMKDSTTD